MKILGISSNNYHDASAALVVDGVLIACSSEERFTMQKHDPNFPVHAINFCLRQGGIKSSDLDFVAYHEVPEVKLTRSLSASFFDFPLSRKIFSQSMKEAMNSSFSLRQRVSTELDIEPEKIIFTPHHMSHAAHAFLTSPFEKTAILTVDGVGEWMSGGIFLADRNSADPIKPLHLITFPHSLGILYAAFTGYLGFRVNDSECSTMALAAFGKPTYVNKIREIVKSHPDGTYELDLSFFNFINPHELPLTDKFIKLFGPARNFKEPLRFNCMGNAPGEISAEEQRFADIACSIQKVVEEELIKLALKAKELTGSDNLCFSGGVALNCVANSKLIEHGIFKNVHIPIDPGDGGGAIGAAMYSSLLIEPKLQKKPATVSPYLGESLDELTLKSVLKEFSEKENYQVLNFDSEELLLKHCAGLLFSEKIMGWVQGRAENGPRALGHRSILIRPDKIDLAQRLSVSVKKRAKFRPYACSVAVDAAASMFDLKSIENYKWMQTSAAVNPKFHDQIQAALHIDGSTRPQICTVSDNERYYNLLKNYGELSGLPALLNTSFNLSGFPLVNAGLDALMMFATTEMDVLVVNNWVIEKR